MKKTTLSLLLLATLTTASEVEYGKGTFNLTGGFLGLSQTITEDVTTYSMVERHANIPASKLFYGYDFTWYDSQTLKQVESTINLGTGLINNPLIPANNNLQVPAMDYRVKGLDANIQLGYDVIHKDADNFLGLGALVGISIPWIDALQGSSNNNAQANYFKDSKTEFMTYKIGPAINFKKTLVDNKISLYGSAAYAYQTGSIKNDYAQAKYTVNGTYQEYNLGLYFTPFTKTYKWGWLSLSPRVYATLGYKYSKWTVNDMTIDTSGAQLSSAVLSPLNTKFQMDSSTTYAGIGYSF